MVLRVKILQKNVKTHIPATEPCFVTPSQTTAFKASGQGQDLHLHGLSQIGQYYNISHNALPITNEIFNANFPHF